jgi:hypothetical protein
VRRRRRGRRQEREEERKEVGVVRRGWEVHQTKYY